MTTIAPALLNVTADITAANGETVALSPNPALIDHTLPWEIVVDHMVDGHREMVSVGAEDGEVVASIDHIGQDDERGISAYLTPADARAVAAALVEAADLADAGTEVRR